MPILFVILHHETNIITLQKEFTIMKRINNKSDFNRFFSLSVDGKFFGLDAFGEHFAALLLHKLNRMLFNGSSHSKPLDDIICMRVCSHNVKIYNC